MRQQQSLQYELEKNKAELEEYREELVSHFARSAELLDNMATDYRQLYQHMAKSSSSLLPEMTAEPIHSVTVWPTLKPVTIRPLFRCHATIQMARPGLLRGGAKTRLIAPT